MLVRTNIYQISGRYGGGVFGANVFLLEGNDLTLVDTGFKGRAASILGAIKKLGYSPSDVARIIITHHHIDHVGSLAALKKATRARVIAHGEDAPYINGQLPQPGLVVSSRLSRAVASLHWLWDCAPAEVDMLIDDGDEIPLLGGIKVLHTPGHTPGSICLFLQKERLVIVGDLLSHGPALRLPAKKYTVDLTQEIDSISKLASLDFDTICFGHGVPIMRKARAAVAHFAETIASKYRKTT
jgi:hydroxyacylglutathione hydrolase